jgi:sulfide dehydrogenase [flavocytochrome c] flavoprotein chain
MTINRRFFLGGSTAALSALTLGTPMAFGQAKPRVVVIGGGPGGATAAKYIAKDSAGAIEVTLVEPFNTFTTCFHSNLYLGGYKTFEQITHSYDKLKAAYGITHAKDRAVSIDRDKKLVRLAGGNTLAYDRLIVSPGIDLKYDSVPGWGEAHVEASF